MERNTDLTGRPPWYHLLFKQACHGDGNCLFRAYSDQLYGFQKYCSYIRLMAVETMRLCRNEFEQFVDNTDNPEANFDDYLGKVSRNGEWSDDRELRALSLLYDMPVEIYDAEFRIHKTFYDEQCNNRIDERVIRILWESNPGHYSSVRMRGVPFPLSDPNFVGCLEIRGIEAILKKLAVSNPRDGAQTIHRQVCEQLANVEKPLKPYHSEWGTATTQSSYVRKKFVGYNEANNPEFIFFSHAGHYGIPRNCTVISFEDKKKASFVRSDTTSLLKWSAPKIALPRFNTSSLVLSGVVDDSTHPIDRDLSSIGSEVSGRGDSSTISKRGKIPFSLTRSQEPCISLFTTKDARMLHERADGSTISGTPSASNSKVDLLQSDASDHSPLPKQEFQQEVQTRIVKTIMSSNIPLRHDINRSSFFKDRTVFDKTKSFRKMEGIPEFPLTTPNPSKVSVVPLPLDSEDYAIIHPHAVPSVMAGTRVFERGDLVQNTRSFLPLRSYSPSYLPFQHRF
ncbi:OTU family cysteine protease [Cardiosporidium cionae]|uniref:OTU family cysteine protease n=1 Tax=Cardiosporidium cionae TaxID=476202 RepID=A0ABQ7JFD2_9APIC|nr:OTU family cysteine protease [Cardiosporidium cionae]|eukprot:KAF8822736.1 OTU family cysteine protease [Cardiosporidium cionae]